MELLKRLKQAEWEAYHYRYGLAGEGQADVIEKNLKAQPGIVLDIGSGSDLGKIGRLAAACNCLIAADKEFSLPKSRNRHVRSHVARFVVTDARHLALADASVDHIVALGLFAWIPEDETSQVMAEFARVCRASGYVMITNSVIRPKERYRRCAIDAGFLIVEDYEGYCPAASGDAKRRYLLVLRR